MKLQDFQSNLIQLMQEDSVLKQVPMIEDNGSWPRSPERERALSSKGACITVCLPINQGNDSAEDNGAFVSRLLIPIFVETNYEILSKGDEGLKVSMLDLLERAKDATIGKRIGSNARKALRTDRYRADDPPFEIFPAEGGAVLSVIGFYNSIPDDPNSE